LAAHRLADVVDSALTTLLASPLHAGTRAVGVASDERPALLSALAELEASPLDDFAKCRQALGD
jgi:hypothetical protein